MLFHVRDCPRFYKEIMLIFSVEKIESKNTKSLNIFRA